VSEFQVHVGDQVEDLAGADVSADEAAGQPGGEAAAGAAPSGDDAVSEAVTTGDASDDEGDEGSARDAPADSEAAGSAESLAAGGESPGGESPGEESADDEAAAADDDEAATAHAEAGDGDAAEGDAAEGEDTAPEDDDPVALFKAELRLQPGDWYVVHSYAGYENRVKANLESRTQSLNMEDYIYQIEVPVHEVTEIKQGKRQQVSEKVLPGYILVRMDLTDESWAAVRNHARRDRLRRPVQPPLAAQSGRGGLAARPRARGEGRADRGGAPVLRGIRGRRVRLRR